MNKKTRSSLFLALASLMTISLFIVAKYQNLQKIVFPSPLPSDKNEEAVFNQLAVEEKCDEQTALFISCNGFL